MLKALGTLLLDPAALLLMLVAGAGGALWGWHGGEAAATGRCEAGALRAQLATVTAARNALQARLDTLATLAASDAARAAEAAQADRSNAQAVHATPPNPRACLDADAARRLRGIR
ncbi:hypothetical protein K9U40_10205 [Xanthobacter autotrophicus]|uniref:hypothetical protein n=1 Tax=Xanthobacter TaxID=279 RepID=UPI0024AA0E57|nr:hypothetical protein [Xanthobacter autotrophicus]MDI4664697.1 hypothetical protein [Xanthobacter autotrophicus]